jgi:hypothetical protein
MALQETYKGRTISIRGEIQLYEAHGGTSHPVKTMHATVSGSDRELTGADGNELLEQMKRLIDEGSI